MKTKSRRARYDFRGWKTTYRPTGSMHWVAEKRGVTMRARTKEDLLEMLYAREGISKNNPRRRHATKKYLRRSKAARRKYGRRSKR